MFLCLLQDGLRNDIIFPLEFFKSEPDAVKPNILLTGPAGTGKTSILHAVYHECKKKHINLNVYKMSCGDLLRPFWGQTEMLCKALFQELRENKGPSLLFIDEAEGLCSQRKSSGSDASIR